MHRRPSAIRPAPARPRRARLLLAAAAVWLVVNAAGAAALLAYANTPGAAGAPPAEWPQASGVERAAGRPTLVMFLHPHCPCSRASLGELALVMTHCAGRLDARVIFEELAGEDSGNGESEFWGDAAAIPGVVVKHDAGSRATRSFGAATSGVTLLYDAAGRLAFHGGITLSRGHAGDNPGLAALEARLLGRAAAPVAAPVFGCGLFSESTQGRECRQ